MSIRNWVRRSFGRMLSGTKAHLVGIAALLELPAPVLEKMRSATDDECEALLIEHVEGRHGGIADWRATLEQILETIEPCLTPEERTVLQGVRAASSKGVAEAIHLLDGRLSSPLRALRAIESFGDSYIVVLVPRGKIDEFDRTSRYWLV